MFHHLCCKAWSVLCPIFSIYYLARSGSHAMGLVQSAQCQWELLCCVVGLGIGCVCRELFWSAPITKPVGVFFGCLVQCNAACYISIVLHTFRHTFQLQSYFKSHPVLAFSFSFLPFLPFLILSLFFPHCNAVPSARATSRCLGVHARCTHAACVRYKGTFASSVGRGFLNPQPPRVFFLPPLFDCLVATTAAFLGRHQPFPPPPWPPFLIFSLFSSSSSSPRRCTPSLFSVSLLFYMILVVCIQNI